MNKNPQNKRILCFQKEGWKIAKENNQIQWGLSASENGEDSQLISENLY